MLSKDDLIPTLNNRLVTLIKVARNINFEAPQNFNDEVLAASINRFNDMLELHKNSSFNKLNDVYMKKLNRIKNVHQTIISGEIENVQYGGSMAIKIAMTLHAQLLAIRELMLNPKLK